MKGVLKGKLIKKLKTMKSIGYLKPETILHVNALDHGYISNLISRAPFTNIQEKPNKIELKDNIFPVQEPEIINVSELMKYLEDQAMDSNCDKENVILNINAKNDHESKGKNTEKMSTLKRESGPLCEIDVTCFRLPDLDSGTLFDPNLLAAFEQAVMQVKALEAVRTSREEEEEEYINLEEHNENEPPLKARKIEEIKDPLLDFEQRCPPGGSDSVILYTTGIRGIRKTFEDCHKIRSLLENLRILFLERDISMHSEFKEELWRLLDGKILPPRLFIKGRYIGGVDDVLGLHEQGQLKPLIEGIPINRNEGPCEGCAGIRFIVCFNCNGSRKIVPEGGGEGMNCLECNENGIVICPFCC